MTTPPQPQQGDREPSYLRFSRNWRNGWLQDGCPDHDCAENEVWLSYMRYALCGVCGAVIEMTGNDGPDA